MSPTASPLLRALIVEDSEFDARLLYTLLRQGGYEVSWQRVQTAEAMHGALATAQWDIILSDHEMPDFSAAKALEVLQSSGQDLPFIIVSGGIGEATAVALMKAGAHDFLIKGQLGRLVPAVQRELREAANRAARRAAEESLRESELRYRLLWQNSPDAILMMDAQGRIAFSNPAAGELFGFTTEELLGREFVGLLGMSAAMEAACPWKGGRTGGNRPLAEMTTRTRAGAEAIVEISFSRLSLKGQPWFVAFVRDITGRRRAEHALRQREEEFRVAREIQQRLFPKSAPAMHEFEIAGTSIPADQAGGDYYDFLPMADGALGVVVADVCGHGMGPALIMAETRAYLRIVALNRTQPRDVLTRANRVLADDLGDSNQFVTALFVRLDPKTLSLTFGNAGHPGGLVIDAAGRVKAHLADPQPPLGFLPDTAYVDQPTLSLAEGDTIVLLTDGIEEAESETGGYFSAAGVVDVVRRAGSVSAGELLTRICDAVAAFSAGRAQSDDRTLVVVRVRSSRADPAAIQADCGVDARALASPQSSSQLDTTRA